LFNILIFVKYQKEENVKETEKPKNGAKSKNVGQIINRYKNREINM
jgi:hypothetical protein